MTAVAVGRRRAARRGRLVRRRMVIPAVVVALVGAAAGAVLARRGGDGLAPPLPSALAAEPTDVVLDYRVIAADGSVSTQRIELHRPFAARIEQTVAGGAVSVRTSDFGVLSTTPASGEPSRFTVPPSLASGDVRLAPALAEATAAGVIDRIGRATVADRPCDLYRVGGPVDAGELVPVGAVAGQRAEICVDEAGLLLRERWFRDGQLVRSREATTVRLAAVATDRFAPFGTAVGFDQGNGTLTRLTSTSRLPEGHWEVGGPLPAGFRLLGRWAALTPRLQRADAVDPLAGRRATVTEVWTRGADVILLEQGGAADGSTEPQEHPYGVPVDLGPLGTGELIRDFRLNEVRATPEGSALVRLAGTVPTATLTAIARALRLHPGGQLVADEGGRR